jgi:hypothetical protein
MATVKPSSLLQNPIAKKTFRGQEWHISESQFLSLIWYRWRIDTILLHRYPPCPQAKRATLYPVKGKHVYVGNTKSHGPEIQLVLMLPSWLNPTREVIIFL